MDFHLYKVYQVLLQELPITDHLIEDKFNRQHYQCSGHFKTVKECTGDYYNYGASSFNEIHLHNGEFLHNIGLRGQGMQVAVLDAGFYNYTPLKAFDSINANGQI